MRFVISEDEAEARHGIGRQDDRAIESGVIEYFVSPAEPLVRRPIASEKVREIQLSPQERVYFEDEQGQWRVGRLLRYIDHERLHIRLPNQEDCAVGIDEAFVRSNFPLKDPLGLLQARTTETPFWHAHRHALVKALAEQRATYHGLVALASANIDIYPHQLTVAQRVLNDPVPRYLLADEVGLGKTIEAAVIIRQHLLDEPSDARVIVLVPDNLVDQWRGELKKRFHLDPGRQLRVVGHSSVNDLSQIGRPPTMLVIDEAHDVARGAFADGTDANAYRLLCELASRARGVLLLSATPILHNEDAFLAMLHLLDPASYPLTGRPAFRDRIVYREAVSNAIRDLDADVSFLVEPALDQLAPIAVNNPALAQKIEDVRAVVDDLHQPENNKLLSNLRSHLQECYRLDRRLLRTRRAQDSVRDDLPKRQHVRWALDDPAREAMYEWLDRWRFVATGTADRGDSQKHLRTLLDAAISHPSLLSELILHRKRAIAAGAEPYFSEEAELLDDAPTLPTVANDPRVDALVELIRTEVPRKKWVVFVSDPSVAAVVARVINERAPNAVHLGSDRTASEQLATFRETRDVGVLVCDRHSEQGLNLQGMQAGLVHFDLPLSANRIEQRIGRLDRIGGDRRVQSYVPSLKTKSHTYERSWEESLVDVLQVFTRSVASLQHVIDEGDRFIEAHIMDGGVEAFQDLSAAWSSSEGHLSLSTELNRIESQGLLDQIETFEGEGEQIFDAIEAYEYSTDPSLSERFLENVDGWVDKAIHFQRRRQHDATGVVDYEYVLDKTLLSPHRVGEIFAKGLIKDEQRRGLHSGWMEFDRTKAQEGSTPVARIGHPFIDSLGELMRSDERGRAYACWRGVPNYENKCGRDGPEDLFFRFDFLVEANLETTRAVVAELGLAPGAIVRRSEGAFPPTHGTVWVDLEGGVVTKGELLRVLEAPHRKARDTNIRGERWKTIDDLGLVADWAKVCSSAYAAARTHLEEHIGLDEKVRRAEDLLVTRFQSAKAILEARISASPDRAGDVRALELELELFEPLRLAITQPSIRLDSVGAMFLAGRDFR